MLIFARREATLVFATLVAVAATLTGCSSSDGEKAAGAVVSVELTSEGCAPSPSTVQAGLVTFEIHNKDADAVTEAELMKGVKVLAEKENIAPGLSGSFSVSLEAGAYTMYCPNAKNDRADFTVTDAASSGAAGGSNQALADAASEA